MYTTVNPDPIRRVLVPCVGIVLLAAGCASHKFVRSEGEATRAELSKQIESVASGVGALEESVETRNVAQDEEIESVSVTAQEALDRAMAAGKLAEGKFLYETVLSDDGVKFGFEQATLSDDARQALDAFADNLRARNENVYVEIQGHTDSSGEETYNLMLGEERAEAVRRYLSLEHQLALHRMAVISYGEAAPIAENSDREGRARNRRVALVVLQ
jgi:outer membrane protein OmpA-like peptidoglycan-associated protein